MVWRCFMHTGVHQNTETGQPESSGWLRRVRAAIADFFDPRLECRSCGLIDKQRRFTQTGDIHQYSFGSGWFHSTASEIEFRCPECEETLWVEDIKSYYPLF